MNPIAAARIRAGFPSKSAAARALKMALPQYLLWEAGTRKPSAAGYERLANAFGCTVDALMGRSPTEVA